MEKKSVEVFYLHAPDYKTPLAETLEAGSGYTAGESSGALASRITQHGKSHTYTRAYFARVCQAVDIPGHVQCHYS